MNSLSGATSLNTTTRKQPSFRNFAVQRPFYPGRPTSFFSFQKYYYKNNRGRWQVARTAETDAEIQQEGVSEEVQMATAPQMPPQQPQEQEITEEVQQEVPVENVQQTNTQAPRGRIPSDRVVYLPFDQVEVNQVYKGQVVRLAGFGAFVDIGAEYDGLVHISQMANEFVKDPADIVQVGQEVQVKVIEKDEQAQKLSLSFLISDDGGSGVGAKVGGGPAKIALEDLEVGEIVDGTALRIANFGVFVDIGAAVDGLVHVSQLADEFVQDIKSIVKEGDPVQVKILSVDLDGQKIALGECTWTTSPGGGAEEGEDYDQEWRQRQQRRQGTAGGRARREQATPPPVSEGEEITGTVRRLAPYGVFIDIGNNFQAMLHRNEMKVDSSADPLWQVRDFFQIDQEVKVTVKKIADNKVDLTQKSKEDLEAEATSKEGYLAVDEEDSYKPSLFAAAFAQVGVNRTTFPSFPDRAIVDPPEDILPDVVGEPAMEAAVEESTPVVEDVVEEATPAVEKAVEQAVDETDSVVEDLVQEATPAVEETAEEAGSVVEDVVQEATPAVEEAVEEADSMVESREESALVIQEADSVAEDVVQEAGAVAEEVVKEAGAVAEEVVQEAGAVAEEVVEEAGAVAEEAVEGATAVAEDMIEAVKEAVEEAAAVATDIVKEAASVIEDAPKAEETVEEATPTGAVEEASNLVQDALDNAATVAQEVAATVEDTAEQIREQTTEEIAQAEESQQEVSTSEPVLKPEQQVAAVAEETQGTSEDVKEKSETSEESLAAQSQDDSSTTQQTDETSKMESQTVQNDDESSSTQS
eukprot:TRINITY_DN2517_c0_g1_i7.p1 TRINITY_DN2517_c0_g1~~TRINITY_DN2517_c0_g1_i7.p1  ORF type:complete len:821 (+),score=228.38 TRINITY_DN2517_c0_g1_i7:31-2463(+)